MKDMRRINVAVIGTGWCGGIRAVASAASPWVNELHIAEIKEDRLKEVAAQTKPGHRDHRLSPQRSRIRRSTP